MINVYFVEFHVSGNFSKNCLAGDELPPCDASHATQFSGLIMNCLAVKNTRQATLFILVRFSGSACSRLLWFGGKGILITFGTKERD